MNSRIFHALAACLCVAGLSGCAKLTLWFDTLTGAASSERIPIRLYFWAQCCEPDHGSKGLEADQAVVDEFNASQDKIQLILEPLVTGIDILAEAYASGDGPDILGPLGWSAFDTIPAEWLDLEPFIRSGHFDVAQFPSALMDMYKTEEGQLSFPFAVVPSAVFYNTKLFDQAGLAYPPAQYGEKYRMTDNSYVEWDWDALRTIGRMLTIDSNGLEASDPNFDKANIVQYGFTWQYENHPAYWGSYWAGGSMVAAGGTPGSYTAQVPDAWRAAWRWTYDGIWGDMPFMGDAAAENRTLGGNPFDSGKVAMTVQPYWYTCCMNNIKTLDAGAMPSLDGKVGGRIGAETFRIWKGTKHPQEAFTALTYLVGEGVRKLLIGSKEMPALFDAVPARIADQKAWLEIQKKKFPWVKNWDVVLAGLNYPDVPSAESFMPNRNEAWSRGLAFAELLRHTGGLDLDKEIEVYLSDLTATFNK